MALYFLLFCALFSCLTATGLSITYRVPAAGTLCLAEQLPAEWVLTHLGYTVDVPFSDAEFYYLMGMSSEPGMVTRAQLERGLYALRAKALFEQIMLEIEVTEAGYAVTVHLQGAWVIKRIVKSANSVTERFAHYYDLAVGDCFDEQKHAQALAKVKQQTHKQGYFNSSIGSSLVRDAATKSVTVALDIQLQEQFHIDACAVTITDNAPAELQEHIAAVLTKKWRHKAYRAKIEQQSIDTITQLLAHEGFFNPHIELHLNHDYEQNTVGLLYEITLNQGYQLTFNGNQAFATSYLLEYIGQQGGMILLPLPLLAQELQRLYQQQGYVDALVQVKKEDNEAIFTIQEGTRAQIMTVNVQGASQLNPVWIEKRFFAAVGAGHYYDQMRIERSIERLRHYYEQQGTIHATISYQLLLKTSGNYELEITINEGPTYHIGTVTYEPASWDAHNVLPSLTGKPFCAARIMQHQQLLIDWLHAQGYLYARVEPSVSYVQEEIAISWHIDAGPAVTFGKTILQGPSWLDMDYIMPRLPYKEGQPFCLKAVEQAADAVRSLQVCDTITIYPDQEAGAYGPLPVVLKLTPDDPFEIRCRFGIAQVSNNFTFRPGTTYAVGGSFMYKNPFNRADQFRFDMDFTRFEHTSAVQYEFPFKTRLPLRGLIKGYDAFYQQPLFPGSDQSLYTIIQRGFLTGITLNYNSVTLGLNYGLDWAKLTNVCGVCARALDFQPTLIDTTIPSLIIESTMLCHYENDALYPWYGSTTLLSLKGALPLYTSQASTGFIRFLGEQAGFIRVAPVLCLAGRIRAGHVFNQFFRTILPPDRFYLGGAFSVRGYNNDLVPPLSLVEHGNCCVLVPRGGRSMVNLNGELRLDVGRYMTVALFQDVGALADNSLVTMHWVAATGGGIRFKTPIGIVRFDIGFKWRPLKHESCCAWFLTLGNPF